MNTTNQAIERLAFYRFGHLRDHLSALEKYPTNLFTSYSLTQFGSHKCHFEVTLKTLKHMAAHKLHILGVSKISIIWSSKSSRSIPAGCKLKLLSCCILSHASCCEMQSVLFFCQLQYLSMAYFFCYPFCPLLHCWLGYWMASNGLKDNLWVM